MPLVVLIAGAGTGGGAAFATQQLLGPPPPASQEQAEPEVVTSFVPVAKVMAPLVLEDGHLVGYVAFDFELEVPVDDAPMVTQKLPLLLHAINMRTYRTPLAAGADGMLPDIERMRRVVMEAAPDAFGKGVVRRAAITKAEPA